MRSINRDDNETDLEWVKIFPIPVPLKKIK